jgi:hypothetical protein
MESSLWYNTADQIGNDDIIARDFEFHTIIDIYAHAGKTLCRCENGWYIELEDSAKVLFQWANGQRYVWIGDIPK